MKRISRSSVLDSNHEKGEANKEKEVATEYA